MKYCILYIMSCLAIEGPTKELFYILKYLDKQRFEPIILTISTEQNNSMRRDFQELGVQVISMEFPLKFGGLLNAPLKIRKIVNNINPHLIHSFGFRPDLLTVFFLKDYKNILSIKEIHSVQYTLDHGKILGNLMAFMHQKALKRADYIVACSNSINIYTKRFNSQSLVIKNGVDRDPIKLSVSKKQSIRESLNLPLNKNIFISCGSLSIRKDPETLIKGFLLSSAKDDLLLFLGQGDLLEKLKNQTKNHSNIFFRGFVSNVFDYLMASDYYLSASQSEGLPNAVLEALSVGLPVCLSDIGPHKEILQCDESIGTMFKVRDARSLSDGIDMLLNRDYITMKDNVIDVFKKNFSAKGMSEEYQSLYLKIIGNEIEIKNG